MKRFFILILISVFFSAIPLAQAEKIVEVVPSSTDIVAIAEETQVVEFTVVNNNESAGTFSLSVFPSSLPDVSMTLEKYLFSIDGKSSKSTRLFITPLIGVEEKIQILKVTAESLEYNASDSINLLVNIKRKVPVYLAKGALKLNKYNFNPGDTLTVTVDVTNAGALSSDQYIVETSIKKDNEILVIFEDDASYIPARSIKSFSNSYTFGKYASPGIYSVNVALKDVLNNKISSSSTNFRINDISKSPEEYVTKIRKTGFLNIDVTIKIKNEGNTPIGDFYITESVPVIVKDLFYPDVLPTSQEIRDGTVVYSWFIPSLSPGEEKTIRYEFRLWQIWIGILFLIAVVYFAFKLVFRPSIIKKHKYFGPITHEKEISITLEVKNRSMSTVRDVIVKDFVPPIAKVVPKFETVKPVVRESDRGTELIWRFDSLRPREERVITYKIKPTVEITDLLRLPKAMIKYVDRKKRKKSLVSKSIIIKAK